MDNNRTWEALSMKDRASFIKLAVQNGYRNIGSIRSLYNSNKYDDGGPRDLERLEYVMRESEGVDGAPYRVGNIRGMFKANKALHSDTIPADRGKSNKNAYTGIVFTHDWDNPNYNPDVRSSYALADASELKQVLGYEPVDFVDAYVYNKIPFKDLGVFEDRDSGERHLLRNAIKEGTKPKIYQTYRDTLDRRTVNYLDKQLKKGIPNPGDNVRLIKTNRNHGLFNLEGTNLNYDGQKVSVVHVKQPDGKIAYKLVDLYDFNPDTWTTPLLLPKAKEGLRYIDENGNPYIMTSPWFHKPEWDSKIEKEYYSKALGGPLFNQNNPIESFQGNSFIPVVRYDDGGRIKNNHSYLTWHSNDRIGKAKDYVKNYLSTRKSLPKSNLNDSILTDSFNKIDELTFYDSLIKDSSAIASYNPNEHSVTVFDYNTNNDTSLEHEIAHSTNKYWPNYKNGETAPKYYDYYTDILSNTDTHPILNQINRTLSDSKYIDLYWDRPTEVYSRLLELKKYLKASPNKVFSKEDIEQLKNSDLGKVNTDPYAIISRYDTDTLYDLLNKN